MLLHLARGNEVLAVDHQSTPGGGPNPCDRSQRCGYIDSETAQAIVTVAGVKQKGRRLGRCLAWEEARTLLQAPNPHSIRGMRDRALLAVLVTCALRRGELSRMNCDHLAMRDGRWVFLDFLGKGTRFGRWRCRCGSSKQAIDGWLDTAGIEKGPIFRRVSANGRVDKNALTERAVWQFVREYAAQIGIGELAPHDLRRTAAKLCRAKGGELEQIQFLLGHESILTTERYLGSEQDLKIGSRRSIATAGGGGILLCLILQPGLSSDMQSMIN
jgi:integrase/recombinase XerD